MPGDEKGTTQPWGITSVRTDRRRCSPTTRPRSVPPALGKNKMLRDWAKFAALQPSGSRATAVAAARRDARGVAHAAASRLRARLARHDAGLGEGADPHARGQQYDVVLRRGWHPRRSSRCSSPATRATRKRAGDEVAAACLQRFRRVGSDVAPRSERLTGWRQRGFAVGYASFGIACAGGPAVAWQTGSRRRRSHRRGRRRARGGAAAGRGVARVRVVGGARRGAAGARGPAGGSVAPTAGASGFGIGVLARWMVGLGPSATRWPTC